MIFDSDEVEPCDDGELLGQTDIGSCGVSEPNKSISLSIGGIGKGCSKQMPPTIIETSAILNLTEQQSPIDLLAVLSRDLYAQLVYLNILKY
jgi:hypothetical protein